MQIESKKYLTKKHHILYLLTIISVLFIISAYLFFRYESKSIRQNGHNQLKAIASLKISQIINWNNERFADAKTFSQSPLFVKGLESWLASRSNAVLKSQITKELSLIKSDSVYENIIISDVEGNLSLSLNPKLKKIDSVTTDFIKSAVEKEKIISSDFYFYPTHKDIHLNYIAPVIAKGNVVIAVLIFLVNPNNYLYPLIEKWPAPSKTSETLIVEKDGNNVLYLNELKHQKNTALQLSIPLTRKDVISVQAVRGYKGFIEGEDYRGVNVLADIKPVPGTNWFMIAQVDLSEIYSGLYFRELIIISFTILLISVLSLGLFWYYHYRQRNIYRELFVKEKELREYHEEFKTILYSIGDGVITADRGGKVKQMNHTAEELTGWTESDAAGKSIEKVFNILNEETRSNVKNPVKKVLEEGAVIGLANHTLLISKDGKEIQIADSGAPIRNEQGEIEGVVLVFRDKTFEYYAEKALRESELLFHTLANMSPVGIFRTRDDGYTIYVNPKWCELSGLPADEALADGWLKAVHPDDKISIAEGWKKSTEKKSPSFTQYRFLRNDGSVVWVMGQAIPELDANQNVLGYVGTITDITKIKLYENDLIVAKEKAENADKLKTEFLAQISHEIRTPLIAIVSYTDLIKSDINEGNVIDLPNYLEVLLSAGKRLQRTFDLIVNTAQIMTNNYEVKYIEIDLVEDILLKVFSEYKVDAQRKGLEYIFIDNSKKHYIFADQYCITQIFNNLIDNAIKYTKEGFVKIEITQENEAILVKVMDSGIGISSNFLTHIFEPFRQEEQGYSRKYEGNGLGLTLVKKYCEVNNASISINSIKGEGTIVIVKFQKGVKSK